MYKYFILVAFGLISQFAQSTKVVECNSCSYYAKKSVAENSLRNGKVIVLDLINRDSLKFQIVNIPDPDYPIRRTIQRAMTAEEVTFINNLFALYDEFGTEYKSIPIDLDFSTGGFPEFDGLNAYDALHTSSVQNQISTFIYNDLTSIVNGNAFLSGIITAVLSNLQSMFDFDFSLSIVVTFNDGSQLVFDVDPDNGLIPEVDKDHPLNKDADGNSLIQSNDIRAVGVYSFANSDGVNDFLNAARLYGIPVTGSGGSGGSGGGIIVCVITDVVTCTHHKDPK